MHERKRRKVKVFVKMAKKLKNYVKKIMNKENDRNQITKGNMVERSIEKVHRRKSLHQ